LKECKKKKKKQKKKKKKNNIYLKKNKKMKKWKKKKKQDTNKNIERVQHKQQEMTLKKIRPWRIIIWNGSGIVTMMITKIPSYINEFQWNIVTRINGDEKEKEIYRKISANLSSKDVRTMIY